MSSDTPKIYLLRHGRPELDLEKMARDWVSGKELWDLIDLYVDSELDELQAPPPSVKDTLGSCGFAYCSPIVRARQTFEKLDLKLGCDIDEEFTEVPMPLPFFSSLRLPTKTWFIMLRLLWVAGLLRKPEGLKAGAKRAKSAVDKLEGNAHQAPLVVGHGIFNHLLARELKKRGWILESKTGLSYWSLMILTKPKVSAS